MGVLGAINSFVENSVITQALIGTSASGRWDWCTKISRGVLNLAQAPELQRNGYYNAFNNYHIEGYCRTQEEMGH